MHTILILSVHAAVIAIEWSSSRASPFTVLSIFALTNLTTVLLLAVHSAACSPASAAMSISLLRTAIFIGLSGALTMTVWCGCLFFLRHSGII
jgi:hypothetical protein